MTCDCPLDGLSLLPRSDQYGVARRVIEQAYRRLLGGGMRPDDVCNAARAAVAGLELLERRHSALEAFRRGETLEEASQPRKKRRAP